MGFSISAATALIFASLFLAFGIFYPAMANGYERVEEADAAKADQNLEQAQTDITFISYASPTGNGLTITAENTGETVLIVDNIDLILQPDYRYVSWDNNNNSDKVDARVDGDSNTNLWRPGEQIEIEFRDPGSFTEPDRFKVITEHGVSISGDT